MTASGWVWWAAWRAPSMTTTRPSASRSSSARVASRKTGRLSPPRSCRTGCRTAPSRSSEAAGFASASSSRRIVPAAAARSRPDRVRPVCRQVGRGHADHLGQEQRERPVPIAGGQTLAEPRLDPGRVVARAPAASVPPRTTRLAGSCRSAAPPPAHSVRHTSARTRRRGRPARPPLPPRRPRRPRTRARSRRSGASPDAPRPRRSMAWTRKRRANRGPTTRNVVWSAVDPWTRTSGGPSPLLKTAIGVPSRDRTTDDGAASVTARDATRSGCRAGPPGCPTRRRSRRPRTRGARRTARARRLAWKQYRSSPSGRRALARSIRPPADPVSDPVGRDVELVDHRLRQRHQRDDPAVGIGGDPRLMCREHLVREPPPDVVVRVSGREVERGPPGREPHVAQRRPVGRTRAADRDLGQGSGPFRPDRRRLGHHRITDAATCRPRPRRGSTSCPTAGRAGPATAAGRPPTRTRSRPRPPSPRPTRPSARNGRRRRSRGSG